MSTDQCRDLQHMSPTHQVVRNSAHALQQLSQVIAEFEAGLIATGVTITTIEHGKINPLQQLDLISQMSQEMSLFLARLADHIPVAIEIESGAVISPIKLEELRAIIDPAQVAHETRFAQAQPVTFF